MGFRDNRISRLLMRGIRRAGPGGWRSRSQSAAYEEAVRAAFNADSRLDVRVSAPSAAVAVDPGSASPYTDDNRLEEALVAASESAVGSSRIESGPTSASVPLTRPVFRTVEPERGKKGGRRDRVDEAVPVFLLHPPTNAAPIADEFFDGLIRWVEDER